MRLYEIAREYEEILERAVDSETGEIKNEQLERELDEIEGKLEEKALDVAAYIVNLEAEAEMVNQRAEELKRRSKGLLNRAESLRRYLADQLGVGTKLKDDRVAFSVVPGAVRAEVYDESSLPERYTAIETKILKAEILRDLKAGMRIGGAGLIEGKPSVRIR